MKKIQTGRNTRLINHKLKIYLILLLVFFYSCNRARESRNTENDIKTALEWGGLAELPANAKEIDIRQEGSAFTREFILMFTSDSLQIEDWILKSPGLQFVQSLLLNDGRMEYHVDGQAGSIGGTVYIDKKNGKVLIDVSWS